MVEILRHVGISGRIWNIMMLWTIWTVVTSTSAQQIPDGFISIDCGNTIQYNDSVTNLTWETDGKYIISGMDGVVPNPPDSKTDNSEALRTFRYFSHFLEPKSKYCYELNLARDNVSVLIRAMFLHGNSSPLKLPISFSVYVGATFWYSVEYDIDDDLHSPKVIEGIFYSPRNITYLCLVPNNESVAFISSLEVRQLDPEGVMYSFIDRRTRVLSNLARYNLGVSGNSTVRYPDDTYDRFWNYDPNTYSITSPFLSQNEIGTTNSSLNNVPPRVMMDAYSFSDGREAGSVQTTTTSQLGLTLPRTTATNYVSVIFYCQAVDNFEGLNMDLSLNDATTGFFNVTSIPVMKVLPHIRLLANSALIGIMTGSRAIVNAMEIYEEIDFYDGITDRDDVRSINFLKRRFNLSYWQGDPCVPIPYDWLNCSGPPQYFNDAERKITSINLSKLNESTDLQNSTSLLGVDALSSLTNMTITDSHIDDFTFQFLIENFTASTQLDRLNLSYNDIATLPPATSWSRNSFDSIDLSHNSFNGEVLSFSTFAGPATVNKLNLSYNSFTSLPHYWGNSSHGLSNLRVLNLSHNSITSDISLLNDLLTKNPYLEEIELSYNFLTGGFPTGMYFSLQNLRQVHLICNLDSITISRSTNALPSAYFNSNFISLNLTRNNITGTLNLTSWYNRLQKYRGGPLFSLADNDIVDIIPAADVFQRIIEYSIRNNDTVFNRSGVLLGGNPYCKNAKSLTQQFLCRSSVDDLVHEKQKKKPNVVLIVSTTLGGTFLFLLTSIMSIVIWRLWRQLSITCKLLQEVQQELTNRKVQPPFFSYHDLKVATRGFHADNKLGSGAFGAVYKGILSDGSIIAVKRLFNSDKAQVLNEFLSEVALISGIKHKHLIQLKGCCIKDEERILVYEFAENGDLAGALWGEHTAPLDLTQRLNIAVGVARGLSYLHEELQPRIIHRDIKAVNVLLDDNLNAKIADFGLAKSFAEEKTQASFTKIAGTRGYFAPEYVLEGQLTIKADVFSFGILLLEIVTGRKCIDPNLPPDRVYIKTWAEDLNKSGALLELLQPELRGTATEIEVMTIINTALSCVRTDPKLRPTMSQVVIMLLGNLEAQKFWRESEKGGEEAHFSLDSLDEGTSMSTGLMHEDSEEVALSRFFPKTNAS